MPSKSAQCPGYDSIRKPCCSVAEDLRVSLAKRDIEAIERNREIARLTRELSEAGPKQCKRDLPGTAWVCTLPGNHQGSHANSFGTWRS